MKTPDDIFNELYMKKWAKFAIKRMNSGKPITTETLLMSARRAWIMGYEASQQGVK
jgi:hypothetical protein